VSIRFLVVLAGVSAALFAQMDGWMLVRIVKQDDKLMAVPPGEEPVELKPVAAGRFFVEKLAGDVVFTAQPGGAMSVRVAMGGANTEGGRVALTPADPKDLAQYPGTCWSDELETKYTIIVKDGKLFADHVRHGEIALTPLAKDEFKGTWFMQDVKFVRDGSGRVTGMTAGGGRVTGVRFARRGDCN
jgi:hypothetical protein